MAFAQLTARESLRDIETCLRAMQPKLYHAGIRGQVPEAAWPTPTRRIYADFAQVLIRQARKLYAQDDFGVQLEETAYVFDSSTIDLCLSLFPWARFRQRKAAIKLHTLMDLRGNIPCFIRITEEKTHDVNLLDELILEPGAFYIMDRGYIDFARLYTFTQQAAFFVIRAKRNLDYTRRSSRPVDKSSGLRSDHNHRTAWPRALARLPRYPAPHQLLRPRDVEAVRLSHQPFRPSRLDHPTAVQMPLAGGVVLQVDQTTPADQGVLRHLRERGQDPDLNRHQHLRVSRHRQEANEHRPRSRRNPANFHHLPLRESRDFTTTYEDPSPK